MGNCIHKTYIDENTKKCKICNIYSNQNSCFCNNSNEYGKTKNSFMKLINIKLIFFQIFYHLDGSDILQICMSHPYIRTLLFKSKRFMPQHMVKFSLNRLKLSFLPKFLKETQSYIGGNLLLPLLLENGFTTFESLWASSVTSIQMKQRHISIYHVCQNGGDCFQQRENKDRQSLDCVTSCLEKIKELLKKSNIQYIGYEKYEEGTDFIFEYKIQNKYFILVVHFFQPVYSLTFLDMKYDGTEFLMKYKNDFIIKTSYYTPGVYMNRLIAQPFSKSRVNYRISYIQREILFYSKINGMTVIVRNNYNQKEVFNYRFDQHFLPLYELLHNSFSHFFI